MNPDTVGTIIIFVCVTIIAVAILSMVYKESKCESKDGVFVYGQCWKKELTIKDYLE